MRSVVPVLVLVVLAGGALRFTGLDWDEGAHLHPDERYLTIVGDQLAWPSSPVEYFDVEGSPLSPYNVDAGQSYLYGLYPLLVTKAAAALVDRDTYAELQLVGRGLSALLDTASIVLVFLLGRLLLPPRGALLAAAFYAFSVLAIQLSHFFTVESWLVFSTLLAFYAAARVARRPLEPGFGSTRSLGLLVGLGASLALVASSKISGLVVLVPVALALALRPGGGLPPRARAVAIAASGLVVAASAYVVFRLISPYAFEHSNWLYVEPSERLRLALEEQQRAIDGEYLYPPAYQWLLRTPLWDPLRDLVVWGVGVPLGLTALAGLAWLAVAAARRWRERPVVEAMVLAFALVVFFYFGSKFVHTVRYLVPLVPFLCLGAAYGLAALHRRSVLAARVLGACVLAATLLYAVAFAQVYRGPTTRLEATAWIEDNVPTGATIVSEHWDDAVPVGGSDRYELTQLPVFDPDDGAKLRKLYDGLAPAEYYALSSPRAWKTVGRLPDRFPLMVRFYDRLAEGALGFRKAAQFTSYPRLLGVELEDLEAEEAFWVYEHPPVIIYRRVASPSWDAFRGALCGSDALPGCSTR